MQVPKPARMGYEGKAAAAQASLGDDLWDLHGAGAKLLEFSAGRSVHDYQQLEVLRAAVAMMLTLMDEAVARVELQSAETASRLSGVGRLRAAVKGLDDGSDAGEAIWRMIEGAVPDLVASAAEELRHWHEG